MGYYTDYDLTIRGHYDDKGNFLRECLEEELRTIWAHPLASDPAETLASTFGVDEEDMMYRSWAVNAKWYESNEDMKHISNAFPTVLFQLKCIGEEKECYVNYFFNGKEQGFEMVFPEVDWAKFQDTEKEGT